METGTYEYFASAGANKVVSAKPAILKRIIIGKDVSSGVVEVSNDVADGDADVQIYLEGSTLMTATGGVVEVNAYFSKGICADLTNQTNVTFIIQPSS